MRPTALKGSALRGHFPAAMLRGMDQADGKPSGAGSILQPSALQSGFDEAHSDRWVALTEDMLIGFDELTEAFTEMIEEWSNTESDEEGWPHVDGVDPDAIDEWTDQWAQAARLMAIVGSAENRDIAFTAKTNLKTGIALGWRCAQIAAAEGQELR
jgi:hypothetical protein